MPCRMFRLVYDTRMPPRAGLSAVEMTRRQCNRFQWHGIINYLMVQYAMRHALVIRVEINKYHALLVPCPLQSRVAWG